MLGRTIKWATTSAMVWVLFVGCNKPDKSAAMSMTKPPQPIQMKNLERFVGKWSGTAEFAPATAEKMRKAMPVSDTGKPMQTSFSGSGESRWVLDGMTLRHEGWYEMGEGKKKHYVEFWTWNPNKEKYRVVAMDNWGGYAEGWATSRDGGRSYHVTMTGTDGHGNTEKGHGTMTFTNPNTMEWTWSMKGPGGKMDFVGTSKRSG